VVKASVLVDEKGLMKPEGAWELTYSRGNKGIVSQEGAVTGSTHDSTAFQDSHTVHEKQRLIGRGEWVWADSAYPVEAWCVTPFKKPAANVPENKVFNYWVSHVRVTPSG
jgi:hypothetical protein